MMDSKIEQAYFEWMCGLVRGKPNIVRRYKKLMEYLYHIDFRYKLFMDDNRAGDGIDLRYRFGYEKQYDDREIALYLDNRPCSVLEMMVALALRCEEHIMDDPRMGNRTAKWFWGMIESLGLYGMTDSNFDSTYVDDILTCFLERKYESDGAGGLFTISGCPHDLRFVEIWYQMNWYLNSILEGG